MSRKPVVMITLIAGMLTFLQSCQPDDFAKTQQAYLDLPATPYSYQPNVVKDAIPALGRVLFYDRQLSINNSLSCSSCHKQALAFSDNVAFSRGFENRFTTRNSMPIQNLGQSVFFTLDDIPSKPDSTNSEPVMTNGTSAFFGEHFLFWDGREKELRRMVLRPIVNHVEMGITDFNALSKKLSATPYYQDLFTEAYGNTDVTTERIGDALRWFLTSINSNQTRLDKHFKGEQSLSALELKGQNLFNTKYDCNGCHQVQAPNGYIFAGTFANIGLDQEYTDNGLGQFTKRASENGMFKIPSLRNVELTAPYMHDGRFANLEDVLDHYSENIAPHPNLDFRLKHNGSPLAMNISAQEKQAMISFLKTLTDTNMITDARFSDPFKAR